MAKSNRERQANLRKRRAELGLLKREFYLKDEEYLLVKKFIEEVRCKSNK